MAIFQAKNHSINYLVMCIAQADPLQPDSVQFVRTVSLPALLQILDAFHIIPVVFVVASGYLPVVVYFSDIGSYFVQSNVWRRQL